MVTAFELVLDDNDATVPVFRLDIKPKLADAHLNADDSERHSQFFPQGRRCSRRAMV